MAWMSVAGQRGATVVGDGVCTVIGCCRSTAYDGHPVETLADPAALQSSLRDWYAANGRDLAFRRSAEPWPVLVSEVMLQQTQVARVEPAWTAYLARFPSVGALAAATPADSLRAWSGLGYNRRALNLWRAATIMVECHHGEVPRTLDELRALPGVGGYTARAVAAIAFGQPVAAVDTNVRRVIGRVLWGHAGPPSAGALQAAADRLVDRGQPAKWTHAVMDIGATICHPRKPACAECPVAGLCRYAMTPSADARALPIAATRTPPAHAVARTPAEPFARSARWLRGRIVDRLRQAEPGDWVQIEGPLGDHGTDSVAAALEALASEGLLERSDRGRVRLSLGEGVRA